MSTRKVVLVHGLWFRAWSQRVLAERLERQGFETHCFSYRTTRAPLDESAATLAAYAQDIAADQGVHFVGHSMGGLLILRMLNTQPWTTPGRMVFMGTPLLGSAVARRVADWPLADAFLGRARETLSAGPLNWPGGRDIGMVAGTRPVGLGVAVGALEPPHDGTVSVSETRHEGLTDRVELAVTHTGMLYSNEVARQVGAFLDNGCF